MLQIKNPWWIVFGSVIGLTVGNVTILQFSTSVLMKPLMAEFSWPRTIPSAAVAAGSFFAAIATPFIGRLIDRHGVKPVTLACIFLFGLTFSAASLTPGNSSIFLSIFCIAGIFSAGQAPLPYAKSIAAAFNRHRGLALGVAMTGVGIGAAMLPKLTQSFVDGLGWRGAFIALGATVIGIAFPAVALFLQEPASGRRSQGAQQLPGLEARIVWRSPSFWIMALVFTCIPIVANGTIFHLVPLLTDRGASPQAAVGVFAVIGPSLIAGRLLCGYLLDRFHAPYVATAFTLLPAVGIAVLLMGEDAASARYGAVLVAIGLGAEVDLIGYLQSRYFGLRAFGQIYGYLFAAFSMGAGLGPLLMGWGFDTSGSYQPALIFFLVILLASAAGITRLPRNYPYP